MDFGVAVYVTDKTPSILDVARIVEDRGFESIFVPDHSHIPAGLSSTPPRGGPTPDHYFRFTDPFVTMGAIAAATTRLRIGSGIVLVTERDPIHMAKEVATVDLISGGRMIFGIGAGWNKEEMANHGVDARRRWDILEERIAAMKAIWANDVAGFTGEHVNFSPLHQWPKPVQTPHPPILLGDNRDVAVDAVVRFADGWIPRMGVPGKPFIDRIRQLHEACEVAGRPPLPVTAFGAEPDPDALRVLHKAGAARCVFKCEPFETLRETEHRIDEIARAVAAFTTS